MAGCSGVAEWVQGCRFVRVKGASGVGPGV